MFEYSQTTNRNPETGIRYGVTNHVPGWFFSETMDWECPAWEDAKLEVAYEELKELLKEGKVEPREVAEWLNWIEAGSYTEEDVRANLCQDDALAFMEDEYDNELSNALADVDDSEWTKLGEYKNEQGTFKMMLTYLGGAPLLWVLEGPVLTKARPCSICVPGAIDCDSPDEEGYEGYGLPEGWFEEE